MTYTVLCTFDLKNAKGLDYDRAYGDLEALGLTKLQSNSNGGMTVIPTTTVIGGYDGASARSVRVYVLSAIKNAFRERKYKAEIFVLVCKGSTWGAAVT